MISLKISIFLILLETEEEKSKNGKKLATRRNLLLQYKTVVVEGT